MLHPSDVITPHLPSHEAVIPGEDAAAFDAFRDGLLADLDPQSSDEAFLTEQIVLLRWHIQRLWRSTAGVYSHVNSKVPPPDGASRSMLAAAGAMQDAWNGNSLEKHSLQISRCLTQALKCRKQLALHQEQRGKGLGSAGKPGDSRGTGGGQRAPTSADARRASRSTGASSDTGSGQAADRSAVQPTPNAATAWPPIPAEPSAVRFLANPSPLPVTPEVEQAPAPERPIDPLTPEVAASTGISSDTGSGEAVDRAAPPPPIVSTPTLEEIYPDPWDRNLARVNADVEAQRRRKTAS